MAVGLRVTAFALISCGSIAFRYRRGAPSARPGKVVTMGDSYQAGTGIHTYGEEYDEEFGGFVEPDWWFTSRSEADCWRDKRTTPGAQYADSQGMESIMMACKGAMKQHVDNQFSYVNEQHPVDAAAKWNNSLLIVGYGGNDIRTVGGDSWAGLIIRCVTERPCHENPENQPRNFQEVEDGAFRLASRLAREASAATIRVVGYPRLFGRDRTGNWYDRGCWNVVWVLQEEADWIDSQVDVLDFHFANAVRRAKAEYPGVNLEYVSTLNYMNRGACSNFTGRMVNSQVLTWSGISDASFHPTQLGFDASYRAIVDSL